MRFRLLQRVGVVLLLVLAALLLGADAGEYPGLTSAGLRALGRGVLPLLVVAGLNLVALSGRRAALIAALVANIILLIFVARFARPGAPPFIWIAIPVAVLLVIASVGRIRECSN